MGAGGSESAGDAGVGIRDAGETLGLIHLPVAETQSPIPAS